MTKKTLVVPLDGSEFSERAIPIAAELAKRMQGNVLLVTASDGGPVQPKWYLDEKAAKLRDGGSQVDVRVLYDMGPADAVWRAACDVDEPVICMTTHGAGRLRWATLGSVAEEVLRGIEAPVVLVGRHCREDFLEQSARIVACVDGADAANELAAPVTEWAQLLGLTVDLAITVHPLDVESAEHCDKLLAALRAPFANVGDAVMLTSRVPAGALVDHADATHVALMALNAHARGGLSRFALGSVTMGVVHLASCPVLVVRRSDTASSETVATGAQG